MAREQISNQELNHILEINKKAIEIHLEVEKQNEEVIELLTECKKNIDSIDKFLFKLIIILSTIGITTIVELVKLFLNK